MRYRQLDATEQPPRRSRRSRRRNRLVRRIIFGVAGVLALCALAGLLLYEGPVKSALARARDAQAQVDIVRSELGSSLSSLNTAHLDVARAAIAQARSDIASINDSEDAFGPLLDVAQIVPIAGSRIAHARDALSVIRDALIAADLGTTASQAILASEHAASGGHAMDRVLSALVAQRPTFVQALTALSQAQRESRALPASTGLGAHTDHLLSVFRERATTADQALTTLVATTDLIQRGSSILLVSQDPAEQRATGGYIGFSGLLRVTTNGLHLSRFISSGKVDPQFQPHKGVRPAGLIRPPQQAETYASWAAWLFRDSNWWPDFPTSAREMLAFYQRGQQVAADGVIAFEPQMVVRLLGFTGPVPVPGYKETLTASNGLERLRYYEFQRDDRTFVTSAWQAIIEQMLSLPSSQAPSFAQSMLDGLKSKELRMFFKDPTMQAQLSSGGVDGAVSQAAGDYLYVVDTNLGYSKLDPYVPRTARLTVRLARDGSALHTLILHYTNTWPEGSS